METLRVTFANLILGKFYDYPAPFEIEMQLFREWGEQFEFSVDELCTFLEDLEKIDVLEIINTPNESTDGSLPIVKIKRTFPYTFQKNIGKILE